MTDKETITTIEIMGIIIALFLWFTLFGIGLLIGYLTEVIFIDQKENNNGN